MSTVDAGGAVQPVRTRIKICGVRDAAVARAAVEAGADAIGMVFVPGTPRHVSVEEAAAVMAALPAMVEPVALFVNASPQEIRGVAGQLGVRTVQLHGDEPPDMARQLAPLRVLKALAFERITEQDMAAWRGMENLAALVLDAAPPQQPGRATGGHGRAFDWERLAALQAEGALRDLPLVLAGGLTPENVAAAILRLRPYAVDVSSGVEAQRGVKDPQRIAAFCRTVRQADAEIQAAAEYTGLTGPGSV